MMKSIKGFSLVEILIGMVIGLIIVGGSVVMYSLFSKSSQDSLRLVRLEHELRTGMSLMTHDIRRAGYYSSNNSNISGSTNNPFMADAVDLQTPVSSCILFAYDQNANGVLPTLNTAAGDERFAYRLNNATLQSRAIASTVLNCTSGTWENLTTPNIVEVTNLTFTITPTTVFINGVDSTGGTLLYRKVDISVTGRLVADTSVSRTLTDTVYVRNDKYVPAP